MSSDGSAAGGVKGEREAVLVRGWVEKEEGRETRQREVNLQQSPALTLHPKWHVSFRDPELPEML